MHSIFEILEAPTDSAGPDLIGLDDLKLALGIAPEDVSEDAVLQAAITFQSRIIAEYCDRNFGLVEAMETFRLDRGEVLLARQALTLWQYPVVDVHEVSLMGATGGGYEFDPPSGRLWPVDGCYWSGEIIVTYSGGYDLPEGAPARLQRAVIDAVSAGRALTVSGASTRDPSIREVQHGDTRVSYFTQALATSSASSGYLSAPVVDLLGPFRRMSIA